MKKNKKILEFAVTNVPKGKHLHFLTKDSKTKNKNEIEKTSSRVEYEVKSDKNSESSFAEKTTVKTITPKKTAKKN